MLISESSCCERFGTCVALPILVHVGIPLVIFLELKESNQEEQKNESWQVRLCVAID